MFELLAIVPAVAAMSIGTRSVLKSLSSTKVRTPSTASQARSGHLVGLDVAGEGQAAEETDVSAGLTIEVSTG